MSGQLVSYTLERVSIDSAGLGIPGWRLGRKLSPKTCHLVVAPILTTGYPNGGALGSHPGNAAEDCSEEWVKGEVSPIPTPTARASTGSLVTGVCRCTSVQLWKETLSGSTFPHLKGLHRMGLWGKAEKGCQEAVLPDTWGTPTNTTIITTVTSATSIPGSILPSP